MTHYDAAAQAATLPTATRNGTHWTQKELDELHVLRQLDVRGQEIAVALHRSLYAVRAASRVTVEKAVKAAPTNQRALPFDRGFTDIESLFA